MVTNIAADELLDSDFWWLPVRSGYEEDKLKDAAAETALHLDLLSPAQQIVASHTHGGNARALIQHANAALIESKRDDTMSLLRFEFLVVKTLRVPWLHALLFAVVGMLALFYSPLRCRAGRTKTRSTAHSPSPQASSRRARRSSAIMRVLKALATIGIAFGASLVLVWLWKEQSTRYYLKLLHAYLAMPAEIGLVAPHADIKPKVHYDLALPEERIAYGEFRNVRSGDGATSMFEFSAVAVVDGRVIVADNEAGRLAEPLDGVRDAVDLALFEARVDAESRVIALRRAYPKAFGAVAFDDIEGLAERDGVLYMIGSHSVSAAGQVSPERHVLMRLRTGPDGSTEPPLVYTGLMEALTERAASLGLRIETAGGQRVIKDLNIEGLAFLPGTNDLLIGLRAPLIDGHAVVLRLNDADARFDPTQKSPPMISIHAVLDLRGQGISALEYDQARGIFMVAAAPWRDVSLEELTTSLWEWRPDEHEPDGLIEVRRFVGHRLEGVAQLPMNRWMLAFDEDETESDGPPRQFGRLLVFDAGA